MSIKIEPITKEELEKLAEVDDIYKKAIEQAISDWADPDDPEDKVWPGFFRAEVLKVEANCVLTDEVKAAGLSYDSEITWYQAGWKNLARKILQVFEDYDKWAAPESEGGEEKFQAKYGKSTTDLTAVIEEFLRGG